MQNALRPRSRRLHSVLAAAAAAALALPLAACGSDSSGGDDSDLEKLTMVRGTPQVDLLSLVADSRGYFKEQGLEVELVPPSGSNVPTLIASGRADLGSYSPPAALLTAQGGRSTTTIYGLAGVGFGDYLVGAKDTPDLDTLKAKSSCKIASLPEGTLGYAAVDEFNARLGTSCAHAPFPDVNGIVGAVAAGRADAMVGALGPYASAIAQNGLNVLVDTADQSERDEFFPDGGFETMVYGLTDNLEKKHDSVVAFCKAMNEAREWAMQEDNWQAVAELLTKYPGFEGQSVDQILKDTVETSFPFYGPIDPAEGGGQIDEATWDATVTRLGTFNLPNWQADSPANAYDASVDMSYLDEAEGK
jgi:ABC-type nitrate/sulfonate/bicarbonate transport system substrate-binding protein